METKHQNQDVSGVIYLANVGTSDLQLHYEKLKKLERDDTFFEDLIEELAIQFNESGGQKKAFPMPVDCQRDWGKSLRDDFDIYHDVLVVPILQPALEKIIDHEGERMPQIDHLYLFATDQNDSSSPFYDSDTCHAAEIIFKLLEEGRLVDEASVGIPHRPEIINSSPADYDEMYTYFQNRLNYLFGPHLDQIERVYLSLSGGTPASNFALLLNSLSMFTSCIPLYVEAPGPGEMIGTAKMHGDFGARLRFEFARKIALGHLDANPPDYAAASQSLKGVVGVVQATKCERLCRIGVEIQAHRADAAKTSLDGYKTNYRPGDQVAVIFNRIANALNAPKFKEADKLLLELIEEELQRQL